MVKKNQITVQSNVQLINCQTQYNIRQAPIIINNNKSRIYEKGGVRINGESEPPAVQKIAN